MGIAKSCHSTYSFYIDPFFLAVPHLPISPGGLVFHVLCNDQEWTLGFGCMLQNGQDALDLEILSEIRNWRCFRQLLRATKEAGKSVPI